MNEIQKVDGFNAIIYGTPDEPLFLAKDIAEMLEQRDASTITRNVDEDEKLIHTLCVSGQNREMWFLTEEGLYEVLMTSRKPQAKVFKKKVKEILKTVRKNGAYMTNEVIEKTLSDPDFIIQLATELKNSRAALKAEQEARKLDEPKVLLANKVTASSGTILIGQLAKLITKNNGNKMGQNRLFEKMRHDGFLGSRQGKDWNVPTQRAIMQGLLEFEERIVETRNGQLNSLTPLVTGKGQLYFINKYHEINE